MKETETLELKKSLAQLREGIISLASMLNKSGKGVVYFGITDNGKIVGQDIGKKTIADVTHEIQNQLKPLPMRVSVTQELMDEHEVIKVSVEGKDSPYSAYGRYYIRMNDADVSMSSDMLRHYFEKQEESYLRWEKTPTEYPYDIADENLVIDFVRTANEKGRMDYVYRNLKETLTKLELLTEDGMLNNAGWYLFGSNKPLTIKLANYPTDSRDEFGEIKEFKGNIFECIREAFSYLQNHITYHSQIIGVEREDVPEIPIRALREIVVNSFAHASYEKVGDYQQYSVFRSFVKIYNPGSILDNIDPIKFASGKIGSKIRNVLICSVLFKYGWIDSFGTGFDRTFTLCSQADVGFRYENDKYGFVFIFRRKTQQRNDQINDKINSLDEELMSLIAENKYVTISELAEKTGKSVPTVHRHLEAMVKCGKMVRIGSRKTGYWKAL